MSQTPQHIGRVFEEEFSKAVGGNVTPASGATFHTKLDVADGTIRWSAKATKFKSFRITHEMLDELDFVTSATGGIGGREILAMAIRIGDDNHDIVVLKKHDFIRLVTEKVSYIKESKAEAKRARATTPILFREDS